jgi:hypothetical protein
MSGMEPLAWLHIGPGPFATGVGAVLIVATLLLTSISFQRACREIGATAAASWFGAGSGLSFAFIWIATLEFARPRYAGDTREALQLLAAPIAIISMLALIAAQVLELVLHSALSSVQLSKRGLTWVAALLALVSLLIGLGPFRSRLGEWHYMLALWAGDAACVGFLAISRAEFLTTPDVRNATACWASGSVGIGMMLVAALM